MSTGMTTLMSTGPTFAAVTLFRPVTKVPLPVAVADRAVQIMRSLRRPAGASWVQTYCDLPLGTARTSRPSARPARS